MPKLIVNLLVVVVATTTLVACGPECGAGTTKVGNACAPNCGAGSHLDGSSHACVADVACGDGTTAASGKCVPSTVITCATGTHLAGSTCVPDVACGAGTRSISGDCVPDVSACASGTHLDAASNECQPDVVCGSGTKAVNGQCVAVCDAGFTSEGDACVPNCGTGTHADAATGQCAPDVSCGSGTIASAGQCVPSSNVTCGTGTHLSGSKCEPDATCGTGTHSVDGACVPDSDACGSGTHLDASSNTCVADVTCGAGTKAVNGSCVPACDAGYVFAVDHCVASCGTGTHLDATTGECVADVSCGSGTVPSNGECVPSNGLTCGTGTHASGSECVPDVACGPGTHAVNGACVADSEACGTGTHLDSSSNTCLPDVTCGDYTVALNGKCVLALGGGGPTTWSTNVQLSATGAGDGTPLVAYEPQVAAAVQSNGQTNVYVVYPTRHGATTEESEVIVATSHDGGQTFPLQHTIPSTTPAFQGPAWIGDSTIAANGPAVLIVWVVYRYQSNGSLGGDLFFDESSDGGSTWKGPQPIIQNSTVFIDRPFLSVGNDHNIYLSFTWTNTSGVPDTYVVQFTSTAATLLTHPLAEALGGQQLSQSPLAVTSTGHIFGSLDVVGADDQQAWVVTAPADDSAAFTEVTAREAQESRANDFRNLNQWLALNPSDDMALVWRYNHSGSTHVGVTVTSNGVWPSGLTDGSQIDDAPDGVAVNCAYPVVTSDENGHWHALWIDNRYGSWATYSSSSADGVNWLPSSFVSDIFYDESGTYDPSTGRPTAFLGDYNSIAAVGGRLFAAWVDTRNGTSQVFFASAPNPLP